MISRLLNLFLDFFLKVHYLAIFCALLIIPGVLGGVLGACIACPCIYLTILAPIGPLSLVEAAFLLLTTIPPYHDPLLYIIIAAALKCVVYMLLRGSRFLNHSITSILITTILIICGITVVIAILIHRHIDVFMSILAYILALTIPTELTILSYVKYRDALDGKVSRIWIPALAMLWSLAIWLPLITICLRDWSYCIENLSYIVSPTIIAIGIAITVIQAIFSIGYLHMIKGRED